MKNKIIFGLIFVFSIFLFSSFSGAVVTTILEENFTQYNNHAYLTSPWKYATMSGTYYDTTYAYTASDIQPVDGQYFRFDGRQYRSGCIYFSTPIPLSDFPIDITYKQFVMETAGLEVVYGKNVNSTSLDGSITGGSGTPSTGYGYNNYARPSQTSDAGVLQYLNATGTYGVNGAGAFINTRVRIAPTSIKVKKWSIGASEPDAWTSQNNNLNLSTFTFNSTYLSICGKHYHPIISGDIQIDTIKIDKGLGCNSDGARCIEDINVLIDQFYATPAETDCNILDILDALSNVYTLNYYCIGSTPQLWQNGSYIPANSTIYGENGTGISGGVVIVPPETQDNNNAGVGNLPTILENFQQNIEIIFGLILIIGLVSVCAMSYTTNPLVLIFVGLIGAIISVILGLIPASILVIIILILALLAFIGFTLLKPSGG
jgi:hypothetical protein